MKPKRSFVLDKPVKNHWKARRGDFRPGDTVVHRDFEDFPATAAADPKCPSRLRRANRNFLIVEYTNPEGLPRIVAWSLNSVVRPGLRHPFILRSQLKPHMLVFNITSGNAGWVEADTKNPYQVAHSAYFCVPVRYRYKTGKLKGRLARSYWRIHHLAIV